MIDSAELFRDAEDASYGSSMPSSGDEPRHARAGAYERRSMCIGLSLKADNNGDGRMDENMFNQFYAQHKPSIYAMCLRMLGNVQAAEEAICRIHLQKCFSNIMNSVANHRYTHGYSESL